MSFHPPKFLTTFYLVIDSKFRNLTQILHFPLQTSPNLSLKLLSPKMLQKISSPLKWPKNLFSPKMATMKISASFPHEMMGWME